MSISAVSSGTLTASVNQSIQNKLQQFRQEFQQLGSDLQSGNLSAAQRDFSTLPGLASQDNSTSLASSNPIAQAFNQLAQDLQSGNISGAQQDYGNLKQDFQKVGQGHNNIRQHVRGFDEGNGKTLTQWGQAPPSANASAAQTAYNSLFQEVQQIGSGDSLTPALQPATSGSDSVSFNA